MKKKIFISMFAVVTAAALLAAFTSLFIYFDYFDKQVKSDMRLQASFIKEGYESSGDKYLFLQNAMEGKSNLRLSLIEPDGNVCFDTAADANDLYDHLDRPEIAEAINIGEGEAVRYSKTLRKNYYYFALLLEDGNVIRISSLVSTIQGIFGSVLPILCGMLILLLFLCFFISKALTNRIVRPLERLGDKLDALSETDNYDELNPFVEKISKQNDTINKQLARIKEERDTITLITDNMQEGLVIMGPDRYILSVNKGAVDALNRHVGMDFTGQNLIALTREEALLKAADLALSGTPSDGVFALKAPFRGKIPERIFHFFSNPVFSEESETEKKVGGAILLLWDVTELEKAERIRREFSANVSHELKTPLTTISGFAELIQNDMVQNHEDLIRFSEMIGREASRLLNLIDDIMRLSQIEEGEYVGEGRSKNSEDERTVQVELSAVAFEVCELLLPKAKERHVTISSDCEKCCVIANRSMLQEVIFNLLDNAIKYNVEDGSVKITVKPIDNKAVITVSDTGIGVDSVHHDRLFERFYRVDKSRSKQTGGTGLGLSIVKHIVELHGGEVTLESELGKGTEITVSIPAM